MGVILFLIIVVFLVAIVGLAPNSSLSHRPPTPPLRPPSIPQRPKGDEVPEIIEKLLGLIEQATKERSHYYVKGVALEALHEIIRLQARLEVLEELFQKGRI